MLRKLLVVLAILLLTALHNYGQQSSFSVAGLPRKAQYSKEKLSAEISGLKTKAAIRKFIAVKFRKIPDLKVVVQERTSSGSFNWWTIDLSARGKDTERDETVMISKQVGLARILNENDLKRYFRDTLVVIDTNRMLFLLHEEELDNDGFFLQLKDPSGSGRVQHPLPFSKDYLYISAKNPIQSDLLYFAELRNHRTPSEVISIFKVIFLSEQSREMLLEILSYLRYQKMPDKEISVKLQSYVSSRFGNISLSELNKWIDKGVK